MLNNFENKNNIIKITAVTIFAMLLIIFIAKPTLEGYNIYQKVKESGYSIEEYEKQLQETRSMLLVAEANISSCNLFNEKLLEEIRKNSVDISECKKEIGVINTKYDSKEKDYIKTIKDLREDIEKKIAEMVLLKNEKDNEITELRIRHEEDYSALSNNSANNICCKQKVDNKNIRYFKIENNRILCLENGNLELSC